jgi:predicted DNA-binding antitoxin AbrB/MazE fold protein
MVLEKVKYNDGTEVEVNITSLGFRKAMQLMSKYIPLEGIKQNKDGSVEMNGSLKLFELQVACLETIEGLDIDKVDITEGKRIYNKYFEESISMAMGQGGNPN